MLQNENNSMRIEAAHIWLSGYKQAAPLWRPYLMRPVPGEHPQPPAPAANQIIKTLQRAVCAISCTMQLPYLDDCKHQGGHAVQHQDTYRPTFLDATISTQG